MTASGTTPGTRRWLAPLGASAAVVAVFVVPGLIAAHTGGSGGVDLVPDGVATPDDARPAPQYDPRFDHADALAVEITGYRARGRLLRLYYTVDRSTDCSSRIEAPVVRERRSSVLVRLARRPSRAPGEVCAGLVLTTSVDVLLSRPMAARVLQDGSRDGALVPMESAYRPAAMLPTPPAGRAGR